MYTKANLEVCKFTSKSGVKPEFKSVAFCGNRTMATDAFRLVEVSAPGEAHDPVLIDAKHVARLKLGKNEHIGLDSFAEGRMDSAYPDCDSILTKEEGREEVAVRVNGKLLGEVLLQLAKLGKHGAVTMSLSSESPNRPIVLKTVEGAQLGRALVMPMRSGQGSAN